MSKSEKISIIGHFGGKENILDGQTIKTKTLFDELSIATSWNIQKVDTYYKNKNPFKLLWQTIICLLTTKKIIVLLSGNGMKFYFPILSFFAKKFNSRIYHDVIGGNLDQYVVRYPKFKKYLNSFFINWVETENLKGKLELQGITNCEVIPNFKRLNIVAINSIIMNIEPPYRFCTFSRVMKEKGIQDAIIAVQNTNAEAGKIICELDIFGRIDKDYFECFNEILKGATSAVKYCGLVPYDKSVEVIKDYYALLFPTYWDGEGFPGTIVDAFSAGLPVIASDWNSNAEIIGNMIDGIVYPNDKIKTLQEALKWSMENAELLTKFKINCLKRAKKFQPEEYIKRIILLVTI